MLQAIERSGPLPAQVAVDYWYPRVAATFGRLDSDRFDLYRDYGLRRRDNAAMLTDWSDEVGPRLADLGLSVPVVG